MNKIYKTEITLLIPSISIVFGHILTLFIRKPSKNSESIFQHFAAGIVCAVASIELMPILISDDSNIIYS